MMVGHNRNNLRELSESELDIVAGGVQIPVHVPVNVAGNSINGGDVLSPNFGNVVLNSVAESKQPQPTAMKGLGVKPFYY